MDRLDSELLKTTITKDSMEFLAIDGSRGEGGGQILRSALALSCISKVPVRIENIRSKRKVPGLRAQHLASGRILARIFDADVSGLDLGSTSVEFAPKDAKEAEIREDVGTAGSISLALQGAVFAASMAGRRTSLKIRGGTDVAWSPTMDYTGTVLQNALERFGIRYSASVRKRGYFPRGGGQVEAVIEPCRKIAPVSLTKRGDKTAGLLCTFSKTSRKKVESECSRIVDRLESGGWRVSCRIRQEEARDGGASVLLYSQDSSSVMGVDSLWDDRAGGFQRDVAAEFLQSDLGVDHNLADMLVIPASRCGETSVLRTDRMTKHLETNLYVTSRITGCRYGIGRIPGGFEVRIRGAL